MPYAKCPLCGCLYHLQVSDVAVWYKERYPGLPVCSLVPATCFFCWQEVKSGDRVVLGKLIGDERVAQPGDKGTIESIVTADDGSVYIVKLDSGKEVELIRAEFRKMRDNET